MNKYKPNLNYKLKLEFLTLYNISDIQKGIQCLHSTVEYGLEHFNDSSYQKWAKEYKTVTLLNGGTTITLKKHLEKLKEFGVEFSTFHEEDLNNSITSIAFIVDERIFNNKKFDYKDYNIHSLYTKNELDFKVWLSQFKLV